MHIFVAEDEKTIRRELTILLENAMYQVTAPENFENIPDQITEASPDLILLDVNLPGMSGFDICTMLRQRENTLDFLVGPNLSSGKNFHSISLSPS